MNIALCEVGDPGIDGLETYSPFCLKVHRALKLLGLPYERRHGRMPADFTPLNPAGQVPVLVIDGAPVPDSTAILARLEIASSAEARLWEELADTAINGFVVAARWADDANWPRAKAAFFGDMPAALRVVIPSRLRRRVIRDLESRDFWLAGADACWERFETVLDDLDDRAPAAGFWLGDAITVADLALFAQLHSLRCDLTPWQRDRVADRRTLSGYLDRVDAATRTALPRG